MTQHNSAKNDIFDYIMRFAIILFGYCCALLAGSWLLAAMLFQTLGINALLNDFFMMANDSNSTLVWGATSFWSSVFVSGFVLAFMAGSYALIPAAILIIIAELRRYQSSLYYCIGGGVIGLTLAGSMVSSGHASNYSKHAVWELAILAPATLAAGIVYWLIAGRKAGRLTSPAQ